jgi:hypothetical protein
MSLDTPQAAHGIMQRRTPYRYSRPWLAGVPGGGSDMGEKRHIKEKKKPKQNKPKPAKGPSAAIPASQPAKPKSTTGES